MVSDVACMIIISCVYIHAYILCIFVGNFMIAVVNVVADRPVEDGVEFRVCA